MSPGDRSLRAPSGVAQHICAGSILCCPRPVSKAASPETQERPGNSWLKKTSYIDPTVVDIERYVIIQSTTHVLQSTCFSLVCFSTSFSTFFLLTQHPIHWMPQTEDEIISRGINEKPWLPQKPYSFKVTCCTQRFSWGIMWSPLKPRVNAGKFNYAPIPIHCCQFQALESPMVNRLGFVGFFKVIAFVQLQSSP